ncbi:hypothetical protein QJS10_CPA01g02874 [Acorus calamus]|uniref:Uncharacterized protein n=1 Tax=Acorus calamus TaxID=4465 RepID=A0AAV9FIZ3_ACOCL|nr:hypothetical protein QJS10_CPA01g02874 [Acorus calamus]
MAATFPWHPLSVRPSKPHHRPSPIQRPSTRHVVSVRAFQRSDFDGFAKRVASGEALRDAWRSANDGFDQLVFDARRASERLDSRYSISRRLKSAARSAGDKAREVDRDLGIGRRWRTFSVDFYRNWPRGTCPACKRQFMGYRNQIIQCAGCRNIVWQPGDGGGGNPPSNSGPDIIDVEFEEK